MNDILNDLKTQRVNYVIASSDENELLNHLTYLSKIKHHLTQITIVTPLDLVSNDPGVIIVNSDNTCLYQQWFFAYKQFINKFDYYIFVDGTTIGTIPYFDTFLISLLPNRGYLCKNRLSHKLMTDACGIVHSETLHKLCGSSTPAQLDFIRDVVTFSALLDENNVAVHECPKDLPLLLNMHEIQTSSVNHKLTLGFIDEPVATKRMKLLANTTYLDLSDQSLNDTLLHHALHSSVRVVDLSHNLVSDASMPLLLQYPIEILILDHNHVSDDGVELLANHKTLRYLFLRNNLATSIKPLRNHTILQEIYVDDSVLEEPEEARDPTPTE
jgi:hypothetical protein